MLVLMSRSQILWIRAEVLHTDGADTFGHPCRHQGRERWKDVMIPIPGFCRMLLDKARGAHRPTLFIPPRRAPRGQREGSVPGADHIKTRAKSESKLFLNQPNEMAGFAHRDRVKGNLSRFLESLSTQARVPRQSTRNADRPHAAVRRQDPSLVPCTSSLFFPTCGSLGGWTAAHFTMPYESSQKTQDILHHQVSNRAAGSSTSGCRFTLYNVSQPHCRQMQPHDSDRKRHHVVQSSELPAGPHLSANARNQPGG